jgi:hypothetical protein
MAEGGRRAAEAGRRTSKAHLIGNSDERSQIGQIAAMHC